MTDEAEVGSYLKLYEIDGSSAIAAEQRGKIINAFKAYTEKGIDTSLQLTTHSGELYYTRASNITSLRLSTPDSRRRGVFLEAAEKREIQTLKSEAGLGWDDRE